jgi:hypothetical protein
MVLFVETRKIDARGRCVGYQLDARRTKSPNIMAAAYHALAGRIDRLDVGLTPRGLGIKFFFALRALGVGIEFEPVRGEMCAECICADDPFGDLPNRGDTPVM